MFTEINSLVYLEHYKDLLREAEQERLARLARSAEAGRKAEKLTAALPNNQTEPVATPCCEPAAG